MPNNATIRKIVSQRLSYHRMQHTLGVEMTALQLARLYGVDEEKACTAALLHDYAKQLPSDQLLAKAQAYGLEIGDFERARPDLLHGPVAAKMAEEEFASTRIRIFWKRLHTIRQAEWAWERWPRSFIWQIPLSRIGNFQRPMSCAG